MSSPLQRQPVDRVERAERPAFFSRIRAASNIKELGESVVSGFGLVSSQQDLQSQKISALEELASSANQRSVGCEQDMTRLRATVASLETKVRIHS